MKLSVILISYDMAREIPRTLQGLSRSYQHGAQELDYEVILVDNGSPNPLDPASWAGVDVPVRLIQLKNASSSPARAINIALNEAVGEIVCLMIDGAHILTPGVFRMALACYQAFENPVVATRYFWLGPEAQNESISNGYDGNVEDQLLQKIDWPHDGYRLFEIGTPLRLGAEKINWLNRLFESNCLFMTRRYLKSRAARMKDLTCPVADLSIWIFLAAQLMPRGSQQRNSLGKVVFTSFMGVPRQTSAQKEEI